MAEATRPTAGPDAAARGPAFEPRQPRTGYQPTPQEAALIRRVTERLSPENKPPSRWALERQSFENICFMCGVQWLDYSEQTRKFTRWTAPSWFPTPVDNQMAPRLLGMAARLLRSKPEGRVRPNTNDPDDREAARVSQQIAGHIDDVVDEDTHRQWAAMIAVLTGTVIAKEWFNPHAGPVLRIPRERLEETQAEEPAGTCPACGGNDQPAELVGTPCPACGQAPLEAGSRPAVLPDGSPAMELARVPETDPTTGEPLVDEVPQGEIETAVTFLFNFFWDPKATRLRDARWCGEIAYVDLDWLDQNFPEMGPYVGEEAGGDPANFYEASLLSLVGPSMQGSGHQGGAGTQKGGAVLRLYEEKPSRDYPHGVHAIVAGGVLLYPRPTAQPDGTAAMETGLPIKDVNGIPTGDFSYTEFLYDLVPGRLPGRTPADDMVSLQRKINGIDSQIVLNRKTLLSPWLLAPKGSGLAPGQVAMRPGATVLYNYVGVGTAPQVVPGTPLPESILVERSTALESLDRLAQDQRSGRGEVPQGVKSGIALNFLREQSEEATTPRLQRWARWVAERKRKQLLLAQQHYREPRAIKLLGQGSEWQVKYWSGADLRGNTDLSVDPGTVVPRSASLKTQLVFDALEQGLIDIADPTMRQKLLEELNLVSFETEIGPDRRRAQKENAEMDEGAAPPINPFDNDEVHLLEHYARMKDPSYDYKTPAARMAYQQHAQQHMARLAQQKLLQAQAGMAPGAPPNGAGPGASNGKPRGSAGLASAGGGGSEADQAGTPAT